MLRLVVLISGAGSNLQAILDACQDGSLDARVELVVSSRPDAPGLARAQRCGVATQVLSRKEVLAQGGTREDFERLLIQTVAAARPDRVVLAGWMLLLSPLFLDAFPDRVINLHPALPGTFPGTDAIARAWQAGARGEIQHTGVMVHRVVPEMDAGPVLATEIVPLRPGEPQADLEARVHEVEHRLLIRALQAEACAALSPA